MLSQALQFLFSLQQFFMPSKKTNIKKTKQNKKMPLQNEMKTFFTDFPVFLSVFFFLVNEW